MQGIPGFFKPNPHAWLGANARLGVDDASIYSTEPLRCTLGELIDTDWLAKGATRLTLGAVNVCTGQIRYFDSRDAAIGIDHEMASGALPPAFPATMIDGEPYWDGGIYSNTPIEVVMDDHPRRDSVIFATRFWQQEKALPDTIERVISRQKEIQYSSRAETTTARQQQIHHLRHVVRELGGLLPENARSSPEVKELLGWGCATVMHVLPLRAPALEGKITARISTLHRPALQPAGRRGANSRAAGLLLLHGKKRSTRRWVSWCMTDRHVARLPCQRLIGKSGDGPVEFKAPGRVAVAPDVLVADFKTPMP
ncbi:DUF3734 domain-containing protein [Pseudomonas shahriarae]|uniref:DUF3734 domain-containing protein n=2 Tax=Pseudomonas shahriarae TaxID=2745512 RepID=A0A9X4C8C7_9PSED|nr:DUF3734 domain-containing protein [Pseudomonas shahriarae]MDD1012054.1 DUF3734 domain-containing protein [Pseudomonas shahriarae]